MSTQPSDGGAEGSSPLDKVNRQVNESDALHETAVLDVNDDTTALSSLVDEKTFPSPALDSAMSTDSKKIKFPTAAVSVPHRATTGHFSDAEKDDEKEEVDEELGVPAVSGSIVPPIQLEKNTKNTKNAGDSPPAAGKMLKTTPKAKANNRSRLVSWLRSRVSQNKVRYRDDQFNLDLTYITQRVIAMGFPAHGTEYCIRNPIDKVEAFLDQRHANHFRVYNLCAERRYDSTARFHGQFKRFPFVDHNAPALALVCDFVADAVAFLDEAVENVVVVHCKAGKGRTGIMVSCLLFRLFPTRFPTGQQAMEFFNKTRTCDGAGLTIPSQQRYVEYYVRILREWNGIAPAVNKVIELVELVVNKAAFRQPLVKHSDFYFLILENERQLLDSRSAFPKGPTLSEVGMIFAFPQPFVRLAGDVKLVFYRRRPMVLTGNESPGFYVWFNTNFCDTSSVVLPRNQLDKVDEAAFTGATTIGLRFANAANASKVAPPSPHHNAQ